MTTDLAAAKALVLAANAAIDGAEPDAIAAALSDHVATDYRWRGMHPFNELNSAKAVAETFWAPLRAAMGPLQRRPDIFLAGENQLDGGASLWVVEMGHLMGLWDAPWLGLPATRKMAFLRYAEFHRIEAGRIAETASYIDILNLISQTPMQPLPTSTGAMLLTPGPRTHDGLLYSQQAADEGKITVDLIAAMVKELRSHAVHSPTDHMDRFWTPDMCWFGPGGIGASAFFSGYRRGHSGPFEDGLQYVRHTEHVCRIGEGKFGGFFGYPSLTVRPTGGFMGMPASDQQADMRIVDLYRREGDKLAENWIFIDLLYFFHQQGLDILDRLRNTSGS